LETGQEGIFRSNNSIHRASIQIAIYGQFERSIFLYRDYIAISIWIFNGEKLFGW